MATNIEIVKPMVDKRSYKYFKLDNGIRCMLIHDPEGDMSAASLDVKVGAALDPKENPGTAHFLEHMLFQGTEKYPSENEYSEFMSNNGGMNNAFTSQTNTNYHFECSNEAFEEGFDRMAQFFICPKFKADATSDQIVSNETYKNKNVVIYFYPKDSTPGCTTEGQEFRDSLGFDLIHIMFGEGDKSHDFAHPLVTQPAIFSIEYALALTLRNFGVHPVAVAGHSIGEYVAACVAAEVEFSDWAKARVVAGGALYAAGLVPWALSKHEFHNAAWHAFVLLGSACMFTTIFHEVVPRV